MPAGTFRLANIWKMIVAGDSYQHYTEKDLLTTIRKQKAREGSDAHFRYSNAGFGVLGLILSKLREMEYDEMLKTAIAEPLGLKDTAVLLNEEQRSRLATGYRSYARLGAYYLAQRADTWNFPNCVAGAGGIRSSARDMLVFLQANMGQIRSELGPALQQSHKPLFNDEDVQIGMGWFHKKLSISNEAIICITAEQEAIGVF